MPLRIILQVCLVPFCIISHETSGIINKNTRGKKYQDTALVSDTFEIYLKVLMQILLLEYHQQKIPIL